MTARRHPGTLRRDGPGVPIASVTRLAGGRSLPQPHAEQAKRLRELLHLHGWNQRRLALLCNRTQGCVSQWLSGRSRPMIADQVTIARTFDVTLDWLLGITR